MADAVLDDSDFGNVTQGVEGPILADGDDTASASIVGELRDIKDVIQNWDRRPRRDRLAAAEAATASHDDPDSGALLHVPSQSTAPNNSSYGLSVLPYMIPEGTEMPYVDRRATRPIVATLCCRVTRVPTTDVTPKTTSSSVVGESAATVDQTQSAEEGGDNNGNALLEMPSIAPTVEQWDIVRGTLRLPCWPNTTLGELLLSVVRRAELLEELLTSYCERRGLTTPVASGSELSLNISALTLSVSLGHVAHQRPQSAGKGAVVTVKSHLGRLRFARDGPGAKGYPLVKMQPPKRRDPVLQQEWTHDSWFLAALADSPAQPKITLLIAIESIRMENLVNKQ